MRPSRFTRISRGLVVVCLVGACTYGPPAGGRKVGASPSAGVVDADSKEVVRRLDFSDAGRRGRVVTELPYGPKRGQLGARHVCVSADCRLPCPCEVPLVPQAFDIDRRGRIWIVDEAKARLSVFDRDAEFLFGVRADAENRLTYDVQIAGDLAVGLTRRSDSAAQIFTVENEQASTPMTIRAPSGETVLGGLPMFLGPPGVMQVPPTSAVRGELRGIFTEFFDSPAHSDKCCFGPAEVSISNSQGSASAVEAPGVPFLDGWAKLSVARYDLIKIDVSSTAETWDRTIDFRFLQVIKDELRRVPGLVTFELDVHPDGTIHLLVGAATDRLNGRNEDGYWYLSVSADGRVSPATRVRLPRRRRGEPYPGPQTRRLTLDESGDPVLMLALSDRAQIRKLPWGSP